VSRVVSRLALAGTVCGAAGCFDVPYADPGVLLIDNFDDGNALPADPQFGLWQCQAYNPSNQDYSCFLDAGDNNSPYSLALKFTIVDPPGDGQQFGGAQLFTYTIDPQDFSGFEALVFSGEITSGVPPLSGQARLQIELNCQGAQADDYSYPGNLQIEQSVPFGQTWQTFTVPMATFNPASHLSVHPLGGPAACLKQINAIAFQVSTELLDGQSAMGQMNIDDIYFQ
jgi:hypothetical protein